MHRALNFIPVAHLLLLTAPLLYAAPAYRIQDLGIAGRTATHAAINNTGQVVVTIVPEEQIGSMSLPGVAFSVDNNAANFLGSLGGQRLVASDINDFGQIVGFAEALDALNHTVLFTSGQLQDLGAIGSRGSISAAINNQGDIVGEKFFNGPSRAFLRTNLGVLKDLGTLGGNNSAASDINEHGTIVGRSRTATNDFATAFVYKNNLMTPLGSLGGSESLALAINDLEQIVGLATSPDGLNHAVLFDPSGTPINLGLSGERSVATDINNRSMIIGSLETEAGKPRAALFSLTTSPVLLQELIPENSGWSFLFSATGINDRGQIVGTGIFKGEPGLRAYLMTPVPEPSSLIILLTAAVELGALFSTRASQLRRSQL